MSKITFTDKETLTELPEIAEINKFRAVDANEIKMSVNELYDNEDVITSENETGWIDISDSTPTYSAWDSVNKLGTITVSKNYTGTMSNESKVSLEQLDSLTSYWSLDGNSIDTVNAYNGTDTDIIYSTGKFGQCAVFNGTTSNITITDTNNLKPTRAFTLGCWINTSDLNAQCIFQSYSLINSKYAGFRLIVSNTGLVQLIIGNNTGVVENQNFSLISSFSTVNNGNWHYIVVTYEYGVVKLFIDGVLENFKKTVNLDYFSTNYIRIGCRNSLGSNEQFFNGSIDDIYFINGYTKSNEVIKAKYDLNEAQGSGNTIVKKNFKLYSVNQASLTLYGCETCVLNNTTISSLKYSNVETPYDFPVQGDSIIEALANATELITQFNGGYVIKTGGELFISDNTDLNEAVHLWRWNINGLGYSNNGIDGPYELAMTMDGAIVADFITTGTMNAERIFGGTLTIGGTDNTSGIITVRDADSNVVAIIDKDGVTSSNGARLIGGNGVLSVFQYPMSGTGGNEGWHWMGFADEYMGIYYPFEIETLAYIPDNFEIISAFVTMYHTPMYLYNIPDVGTAWCYCKHIKLYKGTDLTYTYLTGAYCSEYSIQGKSNTEISGAFGTNGFTATPPSSYPPTGETVEEIISTDLYTELTSGIINYLKIQTSDTCTTEAQKAQDTAQISAILTVIGYKK